jgi:prepilin-type N-terminal cleavage/methylation domain-containing protein
MRHTRPSGFTLLELLLAMTLFLVLLGMLWNIITLFSRTQNQVTRLAERSQLVRSLAQLLEDDLRAAIQDPIRPLAGSEDVGDVRRFGLSGSPQMLRIDVIEINPFVVTASQPRPALMGGVQPAEPRAAELKTIFYDFQKSKGLSRREIDFETPDINAPGPEGSAMTAPEVIDCRFRYYNGSEWSDSWESLERAGLPAAIETTLRSLPLAEAEQYRQKATSNESVDSVLSQLELSAPILSRIVTYLPTSPVRKFEEYQRKIPPSKKEFPSVNLPPPQPILTPNQPSDPPNSTPSLPQQSWIRGK